VLLAGCGAISDDSAADPTQTAAAAQSPAASDDAMSPTTDSISDSDEQASAEGAYISYEEYQADSVAAQDATTVLFFHAPWCPSCQATEQSLTSDGVPDGLRVVKVDYDSATDLKRQYGVTQQHTFVQVDSGGEQRQKWSGSTTGAEIKEKVAA
jgi:thiol-disulfide isomerase/thioredoxin